MQVGKEVGKAEQEGQGGQAVQEDQEDQEDLASDLCSHHPIQEDRVHSVPTSHDNCAPKDLQQ